MASSNVRNITTGVLIALVLAVVAIGLFRPTSEITVHDGPVDFEDATADAPVVSSVTKEGGFRFLGITFSSPTYRIQVSFTAAGECGDVLSTATSWPTGATACEPEGDIAGDITGSGRTADGRAVVGVTFEVDEACHDAVATGEVWGARAACR